VGAAWSEDELRLEVRSWLRENWDEQLTVRAWWRLLADSGWAFPSWPREWFGRGLTADAVGIAYDEMARAGVLGPP
jgi:alkylation response protein AidB-like acyl-CoA dehydrogenase